ncbi:MAG: hypothetical protein ABJZ79_18740, partial [Parasphingorhabdus sp.]|uniref:hypothetical protein n=1 Tax=Parasphingorhabdus sp. TaxID=2709688 RepID=UPI00329836B1
RFPFFLRQVGKGRVQLLRHARGKPLKIHIVVSSSYLLSVKSAGAAGQCLQFYPTRGKSPNASTL